MYVVNRSHRDYISVSQSLVHGDVTIQMRSSDMFQEVTLQHFGDQKLIPSDANGEFYDDAKYAN